MPCSECSDSPRRAIASAACLPPTLAEIKTWVRVSGDDCQPSKLSISDQDLQLLLDRAIAYLEAVTCRVFDCTMPKRLIPLAQEAVQLRIWQLLFWASPDYLEAANDDMIQSFTAGNYSETRRDPSARAQATTGLPQVNPNPWLNTDIYLLQTPACREQWAVALLGQEAVALYPSFEVTEADWGNYGGLYPYSFGTGIRSFLADPTIWGA